MCASVSACVRAYVRGGEGVFCCRWWWWVCVCVEGVCVLHDLFYLHTCTSWFPVAADSVGHDQDENGEQCRAR